MSILIKGMKMPKNCAECPLIYYYDERVWGHECELMTYDFDEKIKEGRIKNCPLIEIPDKHGRLIDANALRQTMYHEAFETDSPMQKWDSGCWIRYKMFENIEESAPTIIEAEEG